MFYNEGVDDIVDPFFTPLKSARCTHAAQYLLVTYLSAVVTVPLGARFHCLYQLIM